VQDPKNDRGFLQPTLLVLCPEPLLVFKKQITQLEQRRFNRPWKDAI
jgi:hypothetical protein